MGNCKDCKHWVEATLSSDRAEGWGQCDAIRDYDSPQDTAMINMSGDGVASLLTKPDFGCVQFERGDNPSDDSEASKAWRRDMEALEAELHNEASDPDNDWIIVSSPPPITKRRGPTIGEWLEGNPLWKVGQTFRIVYDGEDRGLFRVTDAQAGQVTVEKVDE